MDDETSDAIGIFIRRVKDITDKMVAGAVEVAGAAQWSVPIPFTDLLQCGGLC